MGSREGLNEIMFVKFINNICKAFNTVFDIHPT